MYLCNPSTQEARAEDRNKRTAWAILRTEIQERCKKSVVITCHEQLSPSFMNINTQRSPGIRGSSAK